MKQYYHVTPMKNLPSILQNGLEPRIGERSERIGEELERVYLFHTKEDVDNALMNWLGECFEEEEELAILQLSIPNDHLIITPKDSNGDDFWESYSFKIISPSFIEKICNEYGNEISKENFVFRMDIER